jgi:hypothetical protein
VRDELGCAQKLPQIESLLPLQIESAAIRAEYLLSARVERRDLGEALSEGLNEEPR